MPLIGEQMEYLSSKSSDYFQRVTYSSFVTAEHINAKKV